MATGGGRRGLTKSTSSESRSRSGWQRSASTSDDALSMNSILNELRPNNLDFTDWRPESSKRRKKGNRERERERGQSLLQDSPPQAEQRQRTPSTFPRTKLPPNAQPGERMTLENLRQHMTFDDFDDVSTDGERNNERNMSIKRERPANYTHQDMLSTNSENMSALGNSKKSSKPKRRNRNNSKDHISEDEIPDSNQIVGRLMQIRDYIKQANTMMNTLQKSDDPNDHRKASKLLQVIASLKEQEQTFMDILQKLWAIREETVADHENTNREITSKPESLDDTASMDLDLQSQISEATTDHTQSSSSRPRIEDKLGLGSEDDTDNAHCSEVAGQGGRLPPGWEFDGPMRETGTGVDALERDDIAALQKQQQLLKKMLHQQEQLRALQGRQEALLGLQVDAHAKEQRMAETKDSRVLNEHSTLDQTETASSHTSAEVSDNECEETETDQENIADNEQNKEEIENKLSLLRGRLNMLKTTYGLNSDEPTVPTNQMVEQNEDPQDSSVTFNRQQLENKLQDLQEKKQRMNELLQHLQTLRVQHLPQMMNNAEPEVSSEAATVQEQPGATGETADGSDNTQQVLNLLDAQEKLQKLQDVRDRLGQLRHLVQYYQEVNDDMGGGDESAQNVASTNEDSAQRKSLQEQSRDHGEHFALGGGHSLEDNQQHSNEDNASNLDEDADFADIKFSENPEIQDKVKELKCAKDRLKQLQTFIGKLEGSPDPTALVIPDGLEDIPGSIEHDSQQNVRDHADLTSDIDTALQDQMDAKAAEHYNERMVPLQNRAAEIGSKMRQQLQELEELKQQRENLITVHQQLLRLHDKLPVTNAARENANKEKERDANEVTFAPEPEIQNIEEGQVTYSSNDELYNKMRKQRILREELRQRKKEMEDIMQKDKPKRHYRNQDNQSDNISYSTDALGASASADATMATWGGSTVDNLESITEDDDRGVREGDDGYTSDGIVQEEEEEYSSKETYTIENDARQQQVTREVGMTSLAGAHQTQLPTYQGGNKQKRNKPGKQQNWNEVSTSNGYGNQRKRRQENFRAAEDIVQDAEEGGGQTSSRNSPLIALEHQMKNLAAAYQLVQQEQQQLRQHLHINSSNSDMNLASGNQFSDFQTQIFQQQMMISLNQCYQQITMQQLEMQNLQRQMQYLAVQGGETYVESPDGTNQSSRLAIQQPFYNPYLLAYPSVSPYSGQTQPIFSRNGPTRVASQHVSNQEPPVNNCVNFPASKHCRVKKGNMSGSERSCDVQSFLTSPVNSSRVSTHSPNTVHSQGEDLSWRGAIHRNNATSIPDDLKSSSRDNSTFVKQKLEDVLKRKRSKVQKIQVGNSAPQGQHSAVNRNTVFPSRMSTAKTTDVDNCKQQHDQRSNTGVVSYTSSTNFSSPLSSLPGDVQDGAQVKREFEVQNEEMSTFETLKETIYSEVATLISQNESRPHFLIELFQELQLLTTDELCQRVHYSIHDIISKNLEDKTDQDSTGLPSWLAASSATMAGTGTTSELTPSESFATSEEEETKVKQLEIQKKSQQLSMNRNGSLMNDEFDYVEMADNASSLSTPSVNRTESPFARDSLGETVIHLDKALRHLHEQKMIVNNSHHQQPLTGLENLSASNQPCSPAQDQGSESSQSDRPYPKINSQQLDELIKNIVMEVIPVLKEYTDEVCSTQILDYIRQLVLSLVQQQQPNKDFGRFFNHQLTTILQDSLVKFEGRKLRECDDDLLMAISEVLFNELAFSRMMEDLDDHSTSKKFQTQSKIKYTGFCITEEDIDKAVQVSSLADESDATEISATSQLENEDRLISPRISTQESVELAGAGDGLMTEISIVPEEKGNGAAAKSPSVHIELAVSETKPFTRIGSDEDDEDDDESQSAEDPSVTAVSLDVEKETSTFVETGDGDVYPEKAVAEAVDGEADFIHVELVTQTLPEGQNNTPKKDPAIERTEELIVVDLPEKLIVDKEIKIQEQIAKEQESCSGVTAVLNCIETENELAGDGETLREPDADEGN